VPRAVTALLATAAILTSCGGGDSADGDDAAGQPSSSPAESLETTEPTTPQSPDRSQRPGTAVTTASSDYGTMLFDASGQAIYLFDKEASSRPRCYNACAEAWPPVLTKGEPQAAGRTMQGLLGTTERADGRTQVTYAGHPLYYYAHEDEGEVLCHDVAEYGGVWLVVRPDGQAAA
jgi:predicted lipoprotein with Yx(FWY)xxD motif